MSALLFLYRDVLAIKPPWLDDIGRPHSKRRIPCVLTRDEVAGLLAQMDGLPALLARLLYGTGMRLMEGVRLRVKDVDFDRSAITAWTWIWRRKSCVQVCSTRLKAAVPPLTPSPGPSSVGWLQTH